MKKVLIPASVAKLAEVKASDDELSLAVESFIKSLKGSLMKCYGDGWEDYEDNIKSPDLLSFIPKNDKVKLSSKAKKILEDTFGDIHKISKPLSSNKSISYKIETEEGNIIDVEYKTNNGKKSLSIFILLEYMI